MHHYAVEIRHRTPHGERKGNKLGLFYIEGEQMTGKPFADHPQTSFSPLARIGPRVATKNHCSVIGKRHCPTPNTQIAKVIDIYQK
jgi:hypothetical protein